MKQIKAPFTQDQVNHINEFQESNIVHPFTCGNDGSILFAHCAGLECSSCDYTQDWVHEGMADGTFLLDQAALLKSMGFIE
jgi:hypothetical protein